MNFQCRPVGPSNRLVSFNDYDVSRETVEYDYSVSLDWYTNQADGQYEIQVRFP